uniref:Uncharacterized protein n=1 Tax=Ananas comosus var. bracteatus TaxID=296719 RepID=A0A6V7PJ63_ANACO|nr:unnamed protein product [Ananas comosus var. bracteatus]
MFSLAKHTRPQLQTPRISIISSFARCGRGAHSVDAKMGSSATTTSSSPATRRRGRRHGGAEEEEGGVGVDRVGAGLVRRRGRVPVPAHRREPPREPLQLPPLDGITCVVTGATSGIGLEIARQLAESGAHVVMAVRRPKLAHDLIQKWQNEKSETGMPLNIEVMELDLLSLDSVAKFADAWNARLAPLHVLINNAGIFAIGEPQRFSKDGYEEHLQVNHLAPALLSMLLLPSLLRGSPSRIINVNSIMHYVGFVDTEDMNITSGKKKYTSLWGYSNSKLAQVKFSSILYKRIPAEAGINVLCVSLELFTQMLPGICPRL